MAAGGLKIRGHVARANPHWKQLANGSPVLVMFHGPHTYVSPSWYADTQSVPTWNYAVVRARAAPRCWPRRSAPLLKDLVDATGRVRGGGPIQGAAPPSRACSARSLARDVVERVEGQAEAERNQTPTRAPRARGTAARPTRARATSPLDAAAHRSIGEPVKPRAVSLANSANRRQRSFLFARARRPGLMLSYLPAARPCAGSRGCLTVPRLLR